MMGDRLQLIKNATANLARGAAGFAVAIFLPSLLIRHMSALSYGVWSLVLQVTAYVSYLDFGLQTAIGRYVASANASNDAEARDSIVSTAFAALCGACVLSLVLIATAVGFAVRLFPNIPQEMLPGMRWALAIVGISVALGLPASSWNGVFIGLRRNEIPALTVGGSKLLSAVAIAIVALNGYSLTAMASAMAFINVLSYAVQYWLLRTLAPEVKLRWTLVRRSTAKDLGGYCVSLTIWSFSMMLITGLDLLLVGHFDFRMVAAYSIASSLVTFVAGVQCAIFNAMLPKAAAIHTQGNSAEMGKLLLSSTRIGVMLLMVIGLPLLIYVGPCLRLWVGPIYGHQAGTIVPLLLIGNMIRLIWVPYSIILLGAGQQKLLTVSPLVEGLTNFFASVLLGYRFGAPGVACGTLIGALAGSAANVVYSLPKTSSQMGFQLGKFLRNGIAVPSLVALPFVALARIKNPAMVFPASVIALIAGALLAIAISPFAFRRNLVRKIRVFAREPLHNKLNLLRLALFRLKGTLYYRRVFGSFGQGSVLFKPLLLSNPKFMHIGKNVLIRPGVRLEAVVLDPSEPPELRIGDNVNIEQDVHIVFIGKVRIGDNVSITARCSLLGGTHPFFDVHDPVKIGARLSGSDSLIEIGEGSFIGIGTVISPNVRIGKRVVIGSNSIVRKNIPDYSVADGNPAAAVLKYDFAADSWVDLRHK